jgi:hypothetical protein
MNKSLREEEIELAKKRPNIFRSFIFNFFDTKKPFENMIYKKTKFGAFGISNCQESSSFAI